MDTPALSPLPTLGSTERLDEGRTEPLTPPRVGRRSQARSEGRAAQPPEREAKARARRPSGRGHLLAALVGAVVGALVVSSAYDDRTLGARLDASLDAASTAVHDRIAGVQGSIRGAVDEASTGLAIASIDMANAVSDASITASVKTALAADPALSALQIDVTTRDGVVRLGGPAPDAKARERAAVLAAAPKGVVSVDNQLTLPQP